jgi:hypothetical protein
MMMPNGLARWRIPGEAGSQRVQPAGVCWQDWCITKQFCDDVRNACRGWKAKGKPALGFGDKQIQRIVKNLRQR